MSARVLLMLLIASSAGQAALAGDPADRPPAPDPETLAREFAAAPPAFGPVPIWWWSGERLELNRLKWQLARLAEGHIYNAIVLNLAPSGPLYGSDADDPPFFTEEWWSTFRQVLAEAQRLGIRIWFYDQLGFSGASLQARLVTQHPEFRAQTLQMHEIVADRAGAVEWTLPPEARFLSVAVGIPAEPGLGTREAAWIWTPGHEQATGKVFFRRTFELPQAPHWAAATLTADNGYLLYLNGVPIGADGGKEEAHWSRAEAYDVRPLLRAGPNVLAIEAENLGGPAGLLLELECRLAAGEPVRIVSDAGFKTTAREHDNWEKELFTEGEDWVAARELGPLGMPPWGQQVAGFPRAAPRAEFARLEPEPHFRHAAGQVRIEVAVPQSRVMIFYATPGTFDYLNPQAAAALIDLVHGEFERRVPEHLGRTLAGSFQDELPMMPRWSEGVLQALGRKRPYEIHALLPHLFHQIDADTQRVRTDYYDVLAEMAEAAFFKPLYDWHARHGMYCGYDQVARSADPIDGQQWYLDYFKTQRWYGAPGNDMDGRTRPHSSLANLYGRPRVWLEGFHSSGWGQTIEELAHLLHAFYREGATLYNPHAIYYSTRGAWWEWAPPSTCWRQPYWRHQALFSDYTARLSYLLAQGTHVVDLALLYPSRTVQAHLSLRGPDGVAQQARDTYWALAAALDAAGRDFDVLDEDSLQRGRATPAGLVVGDQTFPVLVLPAVTTLAPGPLERARELAAAGVPVVYVGTPAPEFQPHAAGLRIVATPAELIDLLAQRAPPDVDGQVKALHRRVGPLDVYFVVPDLQTRPDGAARFEIAGRDLFIEAEQTRRLRLTFRCDGDPELWDTLTGRITPIHDFRRVVDRTHASVDFTQTPAALVVFRRDSSRPQVLAASLPRIENVQPAGQGLLVQGTAFETGPVHVTLEHTGRHYEGQAEASQPEVQDLGQIFRCELVPTMDNRHGDLLWPPSREIPFEVRTLQYRAEAPGEDGTRAGRASDTAANEAAWSSTTVSDGPRALCFGPVALDSLPAEPPGPEPRVLRFSLSRGIAHDRIHPTALGPKGHVPEEFLDAGDIPPGQGVLISAWVRDAAEWHVPAPPPAKFLHVAAEADKTVWLGDQKLCENAAEYRVTRPVTLQRGWNRLVLRLSNSTARPLRARAAVYATRGPEPDPRPEWIGAAQPGPELHIATTWSLPALGRIRSARLAIAYDAPCQVLVNSQPAADLGRYDSYFMSRSEWVDVAPLLQPGENVIAVRLQSSDPNAGVLIDAAVTFEGGAQQWLVSGPQWRQVLTAAGSGFGQPPPVDSPPVRLLRGPAHRFMGDLAALYLRRRPHPLPDAEWLETGPGRPPDAGRDQIVRLDWCADPEAVPAAAWFRCPVPPGATSVQVIPASMNGVQAWLGGEELPGRSDEAGVISFALPELAEPQRTLVLRTPVAAGAEEGAALRAPLRFEVGPGLIELGDWQQQGLPEYSGAVIYQTEFRIVERTLDPGFPARRTLALGKVRGTAEVEVNGKPAGVRLWHPYEFDLAGLVVGGQNVIRITVTNTLGPHFAAVSPTAAVSPPQRVSGLFGPVRLITQPLVIMRAEPTGQEPP